MKAKIILGIMLLAALAGHAQVFNCSAFVNTNTSCGVGGGVAGSGQAFKTVGSFNGATSSLSGGSVIIANSGITHFALTMMYQTAVTVTGFSTTFTFVPNGENIALSLNNCGPGNPGCGGGGTGFSYFGLQNFSSGASCEMDFYQEYGGNPFPINVFAMGFDSYGGNAGNSSTFTDSSVQLYQQNQSPCNPDPGGPVLNPYWGTNKVATSPVHFNSPSNSRGTTTGDTYSATVTYDGSTVTLSLFDVTAGGSCPGASCFTKTWSNVSIPSLVDGSTAYIGIGGSTGSAAPGNLIVKSWSYTVNPPTASPGSTATSGGSSTAANPTFSPVPGTYSSAQNVTITCPTTANSSPYYILGNGSLPLYPLGNNVGGAAVGAAYSGPINVASTNTLYASCAVNNNSNPGFLPSGVVQGTYTIGGGGPPTASTPTFSPAAGTYTGAQSVTLSTTSSGAIICVATNGATPQTNGGTSCLTGTLYSGPVSVSSTQTVKAVAGGSGFSDSSVGSAAYTIIAATPTFSPVAGTYTGTQSVALSATLGPTVCYTTNGSTPVPSGAGCSAGTLYSTAISVSVSETLKAVAGGTGLTNSSVGTAVYVINPTTANPVITLASGAYTLPTTTTITDSTGGAVISYCTTTYGGTCTPVTTYTTTLTISSPETICANAIASGQGLSGTVCNNYANTIPFNIQLGGNVRITGNVVIQ